MTIAARRCRLDVFEHEGVVVVEGKKVTRFPCSCGGVPVSKKTSKKKTRSGMGLQSPGPGLSL